MTDLLLRRAQVEPGRETDVLIVDGHIGTGQQRTPPEVVDLGGRPVLPGLVDHHVHLFALAASWASADLSPAALALAGGLGPALSDARKRRPDGWIRGLGYDLAGTGDLDRLALDAIGVGPVRVQDRTGSRWILDSAGLDAVLPDDPAQIPDGVERDAAGRPTGVLVRLDGWLRDRLPSVVPDLGPVTTWLAERGVTAVTDAGATNGTAELGLLAGAGLLQRTVVMTAGLDVVVPPGVELGPVKVLLDDDRLPDLDGLTRLVSAAHDGGRAVAVHCVTDVQVVLALAAGIDHRDRIEHGTDLPDGILDALVAAGPTIVVQPGLVATRGDRYLADHEPHQLPGLHRLATLQAAGLRVVAGSDAPYGPADPWTTLAAAVHRRTPSAAHFGPQDAVTPLDALDLLTADPITLTSTRRLRPRAPADLVILDDTWDDLADHPKVLATLRSGHVIAGALPS